MVEEENPKDLILGEGDIGDGESDLDEKYAPPPDEGIDDSAEDMKGDGITTRKRRNFLGKSPIKSITS